MFDLILKNWTFRRAIYFLLGLALVAQAVASEKWFFAVIGGYYAAMGLFSFGCAAGNCSSSKCSVNTDIKTPISNTNP